MRFVFCIAVHMVLFWNWITKTMNFDVIYVIYEIYAIDRNPWSIWSMLIVRILTLRICMSEKCCCHLLHECLRQLRDLAVV